MLTDNSFGFKSVIGLILGLCLIPAGYWSEPTGFVYGNETLPAPNRQAVEEDPWLSDWRQIIMQDQLYQYAVSLFSGPINFEGKITTVFDGNKFGIARFSFSGGGEFRIETLPPESSITTLRAPNGFPDENDVGSFFKQYLQDIGLKIDWSKPEEQISNDEKIIKFFDPVPGFNATATMVYKDNKLIEIGVSMAI